MWSSDSPAAQGDKDVMLGGSIAHPEMQYRSGWVGSVGDSKLSLILQGACFRLGQIWILSLDMIQFTEYGWYAELHHPSNFTATQWTEVHRIWMICSPGSYLMQCSGVFDEDVCRYAPLGGNSNCALLGRKCAIVNNCAILGVKSSIGHLLCAIMCNCTTVHLCRSGGQLCIYVCNDVCPQCTSGWQRESKLTLI